ncbi:transcriptional regulator [Methanocella sp. CWC-04]|uniref:Transcriptional regulator n=1 Tax=Methanooceanicella nereidis TaxID=2052831 RepID=A0AAP2REY8_9EURY|nr:Zn-ribbon domain-containing OB-fold protein [Methanocella sp. CWC-04]MCD1296088.1 transcriptional regulator [Methanocella sp. CWC-04]
MSVPRFWREIPARYNLIGTKCENCGKFYFPPRRLCPECRRNSKMVEYQFNGTGEVVTYSVIYTPGDSWIGKKPYVLAVIKLDEGPHLTSEVICEPSEISIGMRVKKVFRRIGEDGDKGMIHYGTKFIPE